MSGPCMEINITLSGYTEIVAAILVATDNLDGKASGNT